MSTTAKNANWTINKAAGSLDLSTDTLTLNGTTPGTVTVTRVGDGQITATSSNSNIVEVTSVNQSTGVITLTGVANGSATITVSVAQGTNHTAPSNKTISVRAVFGFSGYTWAQIAQIIKSGKAAEQFKVGDYKDITFPTEVALDNNKKIEANSTWRVYIIGINHNASKEGNNRVHFCIGRDITDKEICLEEKQMNSSSTNSGGWNGSEMKTWLNGTFYNALPTDLKNVITACTKYTDNGASSTAADVNVISTSQKIWLLSEFEVFGARSVANQYEQNYQEQYAYYKNGNSKVRYGHSGGSALAWYLRSISYPNYGYNFCYVSERGTSTGYTYLFYATITLGVVPCFTIS